MLHNKLPQVSWLKITIILLYLSWSYASLLSLKFRHTSARWLFCSMFIDGNFLVVLDWYRWAGLKGPRQFCSPVRCPGGGGWKAETNGSTYMWSLQHGNLRVVGLNWHLKAPRGRILESWVESPRSFLWPSLGSPRMSVMPVYWLSKSLGQSRFKKWKIRLHFSMGREAKTTWLPFNLPYLVKKTSQGRMAHGGTWPLKEGERRC